MNPMKKAIALLLVALAAGAARAGQTEVALDASCDVTRRVAAVAAIAASIREIGSGMGHWPSVIDYEIRRARAEAAREARAQLLRIIETAGRRRPDEDPYREAVIERAANLAIDIEEDFRIVDHHRIWSAVQGCPHDLDAMKSRIHGRLNALRRLREASQALERQFSGAMR